MLKWIKRYYVGKGIKGSVKIQAQKPVTGVWLITLSEHPGNILEIVPAVLLSQKQLYDTCPTIVGMAGSKPAAIELVKKIIEKVYKKTGEFDAADYILKNRG